MNIFKLEVQWYSNFLFCLDNLFYAVQCIIFPKCINELKFSGRLCTWSVILIGFSSTSSLRSISHLPNNWGILNNNNWKNGLNGWNLGEWSSEKYFCWWLLMICLQSQVRLVHQLLFVILTANNMRFRDGAGVRALASHQCGPGSTQAWYVG